MATCRRRAARHGRRRTASQGKRSHLGARGRPPRDGRRHRGVPRRLPRPRRSAPDRRTPGRLPRSSAGDGLCDRRPRRHRATPSSEAPKRSTSPIPGFFQTLAALTVVRTDKVYLVGFMGAGKTTLARALGARLGWRAKTSTSASRPASTARSPSIFAREGEAYFRDVERQVLLDLLPLRHAVVATGGGTFADPREPRADQSRRPVRSGSTCRCSSLDRARAVGRPAAPGRRPRPLRASLRDTARRLSAGASPPRWRRRPVQPSSSNCSTHLDDLTCATWSSATSTATSKRSTR